MRNIKAPFDVSHDIFLAMELVENRVKDAGGTVEYPDEFDGV